MIPVCEKVIRYDGGFIPSGVRISVKLKDRQEPCVGVVGFVDKHGFVLDMSTPELAHTKRINFVWIEKIRVMR